MLAERKEENGHWQDDIGEGASGWKKDVGSSEKFPRESALAHVCRTQKLARDLKRSRLGQQILLLA